MKRKNKLWLIIPLMILTFAIILNAMQYTDNTESEFSSGTYDGTYFDGSAIKLIYGTELEDNQADNSLKGEVNMTDNVLLLHFKRSFRNN